MIQMKGVCALMKMKRCSGVIPLYIALLIVVGLTSSACLRPGGGDQREVKGLVTRVDATAKTFTVAGDDGKTYDFRMVAGSKGDLPEIKEHMDLKKPVEVKYRGTTSPYDVVEAH